MNKKLLFVLLVVVILGAGFWYYQTYYKATAEQANTNTSNTGNEMLGGDRDEHGCIGSAGYSWCDAKQKCLRTWEEPCE